MIHVTGVNLDCGVRGNAAAPLTSSGVTSSGVRPAAGGVLTPRPALGVSATSRAPEDCCAEATSVIPSWIQSIPAKRIKKAGLMGLAVAPRRRGLLGPPAAKLRPASSGCSKCQRQPAAPLSPTALLASAGAARLRWSPLRLHACAGSLSGGRTREELPRP